MMSIIKSLKYCLSNPLKTLRRTVNYVRFKPVAKRYHWNDDIIDSRAITFRDIHMGQRVRIGRNCRVQGIIRYLPNTSYTPDIILEDGVSIQQNIHLTCATRIRIGKDTAIGSNVTITDINHCYEDICTPIELQPIEFRPIDIGSGCKIYNGAVILPGTTIGRNCVVGANAVVSGEFPDYCVIAGVPAKIKKRYNSVSNKWEKE